MPYSAGSAELTIVPSFEVLASALKAEAEKWGETAGESFASTFNAIVIEATKDALGSLDAEGADRGDSSGAAFADAFKARVEAALASLPDVEINADSTETDAKLAEIRGELESLSGQTIGVDISDTDAVAKLAALQTALDEIGASSESVQLRVDTAAASAELAAFATEVEATKADLDGLGGGAGGAGSGLAALSGDAGSASEGLGTLATTALALGPALVPIGATLVAGIGALVPAFLAAGAGVGAFALAASGDLTKVENAASSTLDTFRQLAAPEVLPVIDQSISLIGPAFAALMPLVDATATELGKLETAAQQTFTAPFWQGFITFLGAEAGPAISSFATLAGGLATAFAGVSVALAPVIADIEQDLDQVGAKLSSFGQNVGSSSGFESFIGYVQTEGPVVGQLLLNLAGDIGGLVGDLAPLGAAVVAVLDPLTGFAQQLLAIHGPFGTNIVDLGLAYLAYSKLAPVVASAQASILAFTTTTEGVEGVAGGSESALAGMVAAMGGIGPAAALAVPVLGAIGLAIWSIGNESRTAQAQATAFLGGITTEAASTLPQLTAKLADLEEKVDELKSAFLDGQLSFGAFADAANDLKSSIDTTQSSIATYRSNLADLSQQLGLSDSSVESLAKSINVDLSKALTPSQVRQFTSALQEQATQSGLTAGALEDLAKSAGESTSAIATAVSGAASATKTAWDSLGDAVTNFANNTLPPTASQIAAFYTSQQKQAAQFGANIMKAIQDGYNPTLISQILQAGPAQAGQLLQGLVSAQGAGLQQLINQTTAALASEGTQAVEEARLTEIAVTAQSSTIAAALPTALALSQQLTVTNAAAAVLAVANQYGLGLPQVLAVAKEYGIALPNNIQAEITDTQTQTAAQAQVVATALGAGQPAIGAVAQAIASAVPGAVTSSLGAVDAAGIATTSHFTSSIAAGNPAATTAGAGLTASVSAGIGATFTSLIAAAQSVANTVISTVNSKQSQLNAVGANMTAGISAGIMSSSAISGLEASAVNVVNLALAAAKNAANSHSPSQLFADEVGHWLTLGVAEGMTSSSALDSVADAAQTIIDSAQAAFRGASIGSLVGSVSGTTAIASQPAGLLRALVGADVGAGAMGSPLGGLADIMPNLSVVAPMRSLVSPMHAGVPAAAPPFAPVLHMSGLGLTAPQVEQVATNVLNRAAAEYMDEYRAR